MPPRAMYVGALLGFVFCAATPAEATQETAPPRTANDVILSTKTPLGEATIALPADSVVTEYVDEGESIILRQGPFAASVPREQIVFGTVVVATPPVTPAQTEPGPATPTPAPAPSENPEDPPTSLGWADIPRPADWKSLLPTAAAVLLGTYALFATLALARLRRRAAREASSSSPALPAVVTGGGNSIACPLCGKDIAVGKLRSGRNRCPACGGAFVAERP